MAKIYSVQKVNGQFANEEGNIELNLGLDTELVVAVNGQTIFNIFAEPTKSNLFISDNIYFKDKSYTIQYISGAWKLVWLNEFQLETTDTLIFRTF